MPRVLVGVSGWSYPPWRGVFYPPGLPQRLEFAYASRRFDALEVNGTFYSLQRPSTYAAWYEQSPPGFVLALKGPRYITHLRRLKDVRAPLANFFASGPLLLREKLGPVLWQFPPQMRFDPARFRAFFEMLPRDSRQAARLAREHDAWLAGRVHTDADRRRPLRYAVEFRHESFLTDGFVDLLREHGIALVVADVAGAFPTAEDVTADWVYLRLHGSRELYRSGYTPREIEYWARRIEAWRDGREPDGARRIAAPAPLAPGGRDVYVFFDNTDVRLRAPADARRLAARLGVGSAATPRGVLADLGINIRRAGSTPPVRGRRGRQSRST